MAENSGIHNWASQKLLGIMNSISEACRKRLTGGFNELVSKRMTAASVRVGKSV